MKKMIGLFLLISMIGVVCSGCYNTERHARRFQQSVENVCLDGTGIN